MNPVRSISYSKYSLFNQCPKKFKYIYIEKFKEPPSEILERGSAMHKSMEEHLTIPNFPVPSFADWLVPYLKPIKKYLIAEEFWQADKDFKPLPSFHPDIKYVGKVDAYFVKGSMLVLIDWKTGKVREKNMEQLELYAILALNKFSEVQEVKPVPNHVFIKVSRQLRQRHVMLFVELNYFCI